MNPTQSQIERVEIDLSLRILRAMPSRATRMYAILRKLLPEAPADGDRAELLKARDEMLAMYADVGAALPILERHLASSPSQEQP